MARDFMKNDVPEEWRIRAKAGLCPVCGKPQTEFGNRMQVYCSQECRDIYAQKYTFWSVLRAKVLKRDGETCAICGMDFEKHRIIVAQKVHEASKEWIQKNREFIDAMRDKALVELDKRFREDFEQIMNDDTFIETSNIPWETRKDIKKIENRYLTFEVDHIKAICNGGDPWDEENLQVVCTPCHKKKTKKDIREMLLDESQTRLNRIFEI